MPSTIAANTAVEGRAAVEVELKLPNNTSLSFDDLNIVHVSSNVAESVTGASTHELVVRAPTTDYVDTIIRQAQSEGTPRIRYRIGVGKPGTMLYLPWQEHLIVNFSAAIEGLGQSAGHFVRFSLKDALFAMSRVTKVAARRGLVSDIVQQIARDNEFASLVVEPTVGDGLWVQNFVDDEDFIRNRLVRRAINSKGRGCYNFYVQDNTLHFHSPDYQAQLKQLVYYQANNLSLTQLDEAQPKLEFGASNTRVVTYDPYAGTMAELVSDPTKALRLGNTITPLNQVTGADLSYPFHISTNTSQEAQNIAQTVYENARMQTMGLRLVIARSIFLRVGDLVQVSISPSGGKNSVWSGVYYVTNTSYQIENGAMVSMFIIKRGEYQASSQAPSSIMVLGQNLVVDNQQAPGQPLNLSLVQSSQLTHGAGQSAATSVYVDTQDANAAPNPSPGY